MRTRHCQGNCRRRWPYRQGARFTRDARSLSIAAALKLQLCMLGRTATELSVIGVLHLAAVIRIVRARGAAARQRAVELESFRALRTQTPNPSA